jgi:predicted DNA-binding transcriptional regulator AlpA
MSENRRLRTPAAAEYLGIAASTLEKMRVAGTGPVFERVGPRAVVYSTAALDEYLAARRAISTSQQSFGVPSRSPKATREPATTGA